MVVHPKLRLALLGTRGLPAAYGGFETFVDELSKRLTARGHEVTVFQRHSWRTGLRSRDELALNGVRRRSTATVMHKYAETPLSALTCFIDIFCAPRRFDALLLCNAANSPFAFLGRLRGVPLAINVDGVERKRSKWNAAGRLWYRLGEASSVLFGSVVVADADVIAQYYREAFKINPEIITYGAEAAPVKAGRVLERFSLTAGRYVLYVSRFEPENNALGVVRAYVAAKINNVPLVMVGDAPYSDEYKSQLRSAANEHVVFTGYQFGEAYRELRSNCLCYIQATEVGGTHPALVEAMAYGNSILANDVPEHREVLGEAGLYYRCNDFDHLSVQLAELVENLSLRERLSTLAAQRAKDLYSWDTVTDKYEALFLRLLR